MTLSFAKGFYRFVAILLLVSVPAIAANFSFTGTFIQDDEQALFYINLTSPATITMLTLSYGGGMNAQGAAIARGGFDTVLSLFSGVGPSAALIGLNNDGSCPPLTQDSVTGACWDSYIQTSLPTGTYTLVLTQSDNSPLGSTLGDGFFRDGSGNFTGPTFIGAPGTFWDANPSQRNGQWAVDVLDVDSATLVPEPASGLLVCVALCTFLAFRFRSNVSKQRHA